MEDNIFKVCVSCMTYNQSNYIVETMDGFCMQETSFPFVCTIVDDASTDGEQAIIKHYFDSNFDTSNTTESYEKETPYAHIAFARHFTNRNCFFAIVFLKENHFQKRLDKRQYLREWRENVRYIAVCEGDDYWIDPLKLQKQYDLMELHPECTLCHHNYLVLNNNEFCSRTDTIPYRQNLLSLAQKNEVASPTMFYRNLNIPLVPKDFPFKYRVYQHFFNLRLAEYGDVLYLDEPMSVYRINQGGIYSMKSLREKFTMSMGNLENMIDWFTIGNNQPEVVSVLKTRVKQVGKSFIVKAIRYFKIKDVFYMWRWTRRLSK